MTEQSEVKCGSSARGYELRSESQCLAPLRDWLSHPIRGLFLSNKSNRLYLSRQDALVGLVQTTESSRRVA
jgi:hypothetical protein